MNERQEGTGVEGSGGARGGISAGGPSGGSPSVHGPAEERLLRLMEEFRARQRRRPDLVVRPWWMAGPVRRDLPTRGEFGFVVEYCPHGVESVELAVRRDRVRVEGPAGVRDAPLELTRGWVLDGEDRRCPETVANHLLHLADDLLDEEAA